MDYKLVGNLLRETRKKGNILELVKEFESKPKKSKSFEESLNSVLENVKQQKLTLANMVFLLSDKINNLDEPKLSRIERGQLEDSKTIEAICQILNIEIPDKKNRLKVGFSQGYWDAPIVWINEQLAAPTFFHQVKLTAYMDIASNELIFNDEGKRLAPFDKQKHSFYFSGEIKDMILHHQIDIGFLGNSVIEPSSKIVRIGRLMNANTIRHTIVAVVPVEKNIQNEDELIHFLMQPDEPAFIYYHPKSTSEIEFRTILQYAGHEHETLSVLNIQDFKATFKEKILQNKDKITCQIGLMLSTDTVKETVRELDPEQSKYQIFTFRTTKIIDKIKEYKEQSFLLSKEIKQLKQQINSMEDFQRLKQKEEELDKVNAIDIKIINNFYYEMVARAEKIHDLAMYNQGFRLLLELLRESVNNFDNRRSDAGIPIEHKKVARFFSLSEEETSNILKNTEFEFVLYPEFVNMALNII